MFGYGFEAERPNGDGHGGYTLGMAFQYNFGKKKLASDEAHDDLRAEYLGSGEHSGVTE